MRTIPLAIIGAPFAAWAVYACLGVLGVTGPAAVILAALWAVLWLAVVHLGPSSRLFRRRHSGARGTPGGRGAWSGAVLCSCFLPIPVYALSVLLEWIDVASAALTLPLIAMLAVPLPAALWWMLLRPGSTDVDGEIIHPLGWRRFTPHAPSGVIPPRKTPDHR
ncbi:MAG: hypothetical protein ACJ79A_00795 [Gemmatimonadaceae bacterium]